MKDQKNEAHAWLLWVLLSTNLKLGLGLFITFGTNANIQIPNTKCHSPPPHPTRPLSCTPFPTLLAAGGKWKWFGTQKPHWRALTFD